jgi:hypothetical protein
LEGGETSKPKHDHSSLAFALVLVATLISAASAAKPTRQPLPASEDVVIGDCGFPVEIHFLQDKGTLTTFTDKSGAVVFELTTGPLVVAVTNLETGESLHLNISGPGMFRVEKDGTATFTGTGPWLFFGFSPAEGLPTFFLAEGKFVFENGTFTQVGRLVDLCAALAA